ncbi:MAG: DUF2283 domain-containing protein [Planctomycetota bacterium]|jgi:uncharacterized protein YuzE
MSKVSELLPDFVAAAQSSLEAQGHPDLAQQLVTLELSSWTHDPEADAMYLYLSGQAPLNIVEENIIGVRHGECIELEDVDGMVVLDTDNFQRITGIEILCREDILKELREKTVPNN